MKIIDAHFHFYPYEDFHREAEAAGHENTAAHLQKVYQETGMVHGIVMGNGGLSLRQHQYPEFMSYCIGLDENCLNVGNRKEYEQRVDLVEQHLKRSQCVGIKIYAGYAHYYVSDKIFIPFYELARKYAKPVAVHTGETAGSMGLLKYSHPLTLDEAASAFPDVQFIMCHIGNPWIQDAVAVMDKNENVAADLSGLLEGRIYMPEFKETQKGYMDFVRCWLSYLDSYDRILYGTDWPLVNLYEYIEFIKALIPEQHYEKVFYENAARLYGIRA